MSGLGNRYFFYIDENTPPGVAQLYGAAVPKDVQKLDGWLLAQGLEPLDTFRARYVLHNIWVAGEVKMSDFRELSEYVPSLLVDTQSLTHDGRMPSKQLFDFLADSVKSIH